jgi:hypothetical protein
MKKIIFIFILILSVSSFSQNSSSPDQTNTKKSRYIIFPGCEFIEDKYDCLANKLQDYITENLNIEARKHLAINAKSDTIVLYLNTEYDKLGNRNTSKSKLKSFVNDFDQFLEPIKNSLPNVKPALDYKGNPKSVAIALTLGFLVNKKDILIKPLYGYQPTLTTKQLNLLKVTEKLPSHPNCNEEDGDLKKCLNDNIIHFILSNFNNKLITESKLPDGKHTIITAFKIDKNGKVINIQSKGPNKTLEKEAERIFQLLPKFTPGSVRGKPIIFPFSIPIVFEIKNGIKQ